MHFEQLHLIPCPLDEHFDDDILVLDAQLKRLLSRAPEAARKRLRSVLAKYVDDKQHFGS